MHKNNDIQKELQEISPLLSKIERHEVYEVPEGYFEELPLHLIPDLKKLNTHQIPKGYFDNLSEEIIKKVKQPGKLISFAKFQKVFKLSVAAVLVGLLGWVIYSLIDKNDPITIKDDYAMEEAQKIIENNNFESELNTVSDEDVINFLEDNGHDVNAALIASLSEDNNLPSEADFISNENELENYLTQLNINTKQTN